MSAEQIIAHLPEINSTESTDAAPQKLSEKEELNQAKKWAVLLVGGPPALAMAAATAFLASEIKLSTLRIEIDNYLIGARFDTYTESDCHIGVHPDSNNKDLHTICYVGGNYTVIIPNIMP
jgi:hypothetical protein